MVAGKGGITKRVPTLKQLRISAHRLSSVLRRVILYHGVLYQGLTVHLMGQCFHILP